MTVERCVQQETGSCEGCPVLTELLVAIQSVAYADRRPRSVALEIPKAVNRLAEEYCPAGLKPQADQLIIRDHGEDVTDSGERVSGRHMILVTLKHTETTVDEMRANLAARFSMITDGDWQYYLGRDIPGDENLYYLHLDRSYLSIDQHVSSSPALPEGKYLLGSNGEKRPQIPYRVECVVNEDGTIAEHLVGYRDENSRDPWGLHHEFLREVDDALYRKYYDIAMRKIDYVRTRVRRLHPYGLGASL